MNKLRDRRGFTLTELLCAVLIVLLVSALLTVGVRFAGRTYNSSMQLSEAQELCSSLTSVISDKLRFCGTVTPGADGSLDHIFIQDLHFLKLSFSDTLRLNTICAAELSRLSRQK